MDVKVGDTIKLRCYYESASGWNFNQGTIFEVRSMLLRDGIEDYPVELIHKVSLFATIVIKVFKTDLKHYFIKFTPNKIPATIVVNGPHDELSKLGTDGLDELASICKVKSSKENETGVLLRGRSGKLYSIGSLLHGLLKGKKKITCSNNSMKLKKQP